MLMQFRSASRWTQGVAPMASRSCVFLACPATVDLTISVPSMHAAHEEVRSICSQDAGNRPGQPQYCHHKEHETYNDSAAFPPAMVCSTCLLNKRKSWNGSGQEMAREILTE